MIKNYITLAFRYISRNRLYTAINVTGLSLGLAATISILTYLNFELSYDRFHSHPERIFRITEEAAYNDERVRSAKTHSPVAALLSENMPGVSAAVRVFPVPGFVSADKINKTKENLFCFADSAFFRVFTFSPLSRDITAALATPFSVVLTRSMAIKYFGSTDIIGREIQFEDDRKAYAFNVTGVIENIPAASHFHPDFIASFTSLDIIMPWHNDWHHPPMYLYSKMENDADADEVNERIKAVMAKHLPHDLADEQRIVGAQKIYEIHLQSDLEDEWEPNSNLSYIILFGGTGVLILLLACMNFINLATALSLQRLKEVGVRKVMGADRPGLIFQFLTEAFCVVLISFCFGIALAEIGLSVLLRKIQGVDFTLQFMFTWPEILLIPSMLLLVTILAGGYPAFFISRFTSAASLRAKGNMTHSNLLLRKSLLVSQFVISIGLLFGMWLVLKQTGYIQNKNLGFTKDWMITLIMVDKYSSKNYQQLKTELLKNARVQAAAISSTVPGKPDFYTFSFHADGMPGEKTIKTLGVDEDYIRTFGIQLTGGRDFTAQPPSDQSGFIVNEAAVRRFAWKEPIGHELELTVYTDKEERRKGPIIGIVKDFNFESLYNKVEPLLLYVNKHPHYVDYLTVRLNPGPANEAIAMLENTWKKFNPAKPMEYQIMDDELSKLYASEITKSKLISVFSVLSLLLSAVGVFGLSSFLIAQRTKEIGVRKVLGASVMSILKLISVEFIRLVIVASAIGIPVAWYISLQWLEGFAYKVQVDIIMLAGVIATMIALTISTVLYQSFRAALMNPVDSLRNE